ncbi:hypothetical protein DM02DRAFT_611657 [Periconia macrospinosa]|uniref:Uncharacterized protein n=1 Tax=Periconia macrospinosa TaxID=97972 RepID=A0A2V1E260_9PLEO|nr:hypothetical protein DM02DRAFT_611657 [Periconia macrospinosa]
MTRNAPEPNVTPRPPPLKRAAPPAPLVPNLETTPTSVLTPRVPQEHIDKDTEYVKD